MAGIRAQACLLRLVIDQPLVLERAASELEEHCNHLQQGFRALVHDLYPVVLQHLPLCEAIGMLARASASSDGTTHQWITPGTESTP